ncbi:cupin domain-containing protein [Paenibacillus yanchengensis]|uniref:Cupin domain-containing protein n=1 Tax=Paenibacillus yanchengensis TaxID=2035833 RepID=A0ABW4YHL5_9BACL
MYYVPSYYNYYYAPNMASRSGCGGCRSQGNSYYVNYPNYFSYPFTLPSLTSAYSYYSTPMATDYYNEIQFDTPHLAEERTDELEEARVILQDYGPQPLVIDIEDATEDNRNYRTTLWTGKHFQVTLMSIPVGGDIGLELHPTNDQFIRIEEGKALVQMGPQQHQLNYERQADDGDAIIVPAGTWHNVINIGHKPLKVYVIYAPPHHPHGTVHRTKAEAMAAEA